MKINDKYCFENVTMQNFHCLDRQVMKFFFEVQITRTNYVNIVLKLSQSNRMQLMILFDQKYLIHLCLNFFVIRCKKYG